MNEIIIKTLKISTHIGVPDEERATPQTLHVDATLIPLTPFEELNDDIAHTVDYDAASRRIAALAASRPRKLIETLASDIADMLLAEFPASSAHVEIRKFILPDTDYVAVRCTKVRK